MMHELYALKKQVLIIRMHRFFIYAYFYIYSASCNFSIIYIVEIH